jgi:hypothetical protein
MLLGGLVVSFVDPRIIQLTKDTDSQMLGHGSRLDSHIVGRRARIGSICIGS